MLEECSVCGAEDKKRDRCICCNCLSDGWRICENCGKPYKTKDELINSMQIKLPNNMTRNQAFSYKRNKDKIISLKSKVCSQECYNKLVN